MTMSRTAAFWDLSEALTLCHYDLQQNLPSSSPIEWEMQPCLYLHISLSGMAAAFTLDLTQVVPVQCFSSVLAVSTS